VTHQYYWISHARAPVSGSSDYKARRDDPTTKLAVPDPRIRLMPITELVLKFIDRFVRDARGKVGCMSAVGDQGKTASGVPITNELIDRLAAKAEEGHDVEQMLLRREGPPSINAGSHIPEP
jgi:hypothetical protein